jgi:hypothetical protein
MHGSNLEAYLYTNWDTSNTTHDQNCTRTCVAFTHKLAETYVNTHYTGLCMYTLYRPMYIHIIQAYVCTHYTGLCMYTLYRPMYVHIFSASCMWDVLFIHTNALILHTTTYRKLNLHVWSVAFVHTNMFFLNLYTHLEGNLHICRDGCRHRYAGLIQPSRKVH